MTTVCVRFCFQLCDFLYEFPLRNQVDYLSGGKKIASYIIEWSRVILSRINVLVPCVNIKRKIAMRYFVNAVPAIREVSKSVEGKMYSCVEKV